MCPEVSTRLDHKRRLAVQSLVPTLGNRHGWELIITPFPLKSPQSTNKRQCSSHDAPGICDFAQEQLMHWIACLNKHFLDDTSACACSMIHVGIPMNRVSLVRPTPGVAAHTLLQYLVRRQRLHFANCRVYSSHFPHW